MATSTRIIIEKRGNLAQGIFNAAKIKRVVNESYSLRRILEGPFALEVHLKKIYCYETEDFIGYDDLSLDGYVDGEYERTLKFRLKKGISKAISNTGVFCGRERISFILFEHDNLDPNDILGYHTVWVKDLKANYSSILKFTKDDAKYDLYFEARIQYHLPPTADEIIEAFRKRTSTPVWTKIQRNNVADELIDRINKPELIYQGPTKFCGPAAVLFEMARHMPRRYAKMVINLYEKGSWESADGTIDAPRNLLNEVIFSRDNNTTPPSDWIALTSMRNSANKFFKIDEPDDVSSNIQAGALTTDVAAWCPQLLGWRITDIYTTTQFGLLGFRLPKVVIPFTLTDFLFTALTGNALDGLKEAKNVLKKGGAAMLQINSDLLKHVVGDADNPGDPDWFDLYILPNNSSHFVSLFDNNANITHDGRVKVNLYTWGMTKNVEISKEGFERETFAFVFTKPGAPV